MGRNAAFWLLGTATSNATSIPANLLDGYITRSQAVSTVQSYAAFAQATWNISETFSITPGLRYTFEKKDADYAAVVSGGLTTTNTALVNAKLSIFRPQAYQVAFEDDALTGDVTASWKPARDVLAYVSYSRGFKSGGINLAGLPFNAANLPALNCAVVGPKRTRREKRA